MVQPGGSAFLFGFRVGNTGFGLGLHSYFVLGVGKTLFCHVRYHIISFSTSENQGGDLRFYLALGLATRGLALVFFSSSSLELATLCFVRSDVMSYVFASSEL